LSKELNVKAIHPTLLFALLLGACAPGASPVATVPTPAGPPPVAAAVPDEAPDNWWLLDRFSNGVFGTSAERAYQEILGNRPPARTVVVAIIDSGVDIEHEDLDDNIWVNEDEIPGNGIDDDNNGYIDDVHGWSFISNPDGRDVHHDTYEVARLYRGCRDRNEMNTPVCAAIAADFEEERAEAADLLEQYQTVSVAFARFEALLKTQLGVDTLTRAAVVGLQSNRADLRQAQQAWLQLTDQGVDAKMLAEGVEALSSQVQYGLNPDFDPRDIVGDDYNNPNERYYGSNRVKGPDPSHGTHVAGIIGAERGNGLGVDGIAPGPRLMILRAVPDGDERDKDVANAIRYAVDNGAHIINMSFGKAYSPQKAVVDEAVRYADSRGVLMVHAAGNDATNQDVEADYPNRYYESGGQAELWLEVGASQWGDPEELAAPFSNYSPRSVDVFAPGVEIYSTMPENEYDRSQGTSMASPVVAGLAALIMAYYPDFDAAQVRQIILDSAVSYADQAVAVPGEDGVYRPFGQLSVTGGIVNAYEALRLAEARSGR
jgi:subtilisin family serine protease